MPPAAAADGSSHGGQYDSSHGGADLSHIVPFIQGSEEATARLKGIVEQEDAMIGANELSIVKQVGVGGFGVVYQCRYAPQRPRPAVEEIVGPASADGSHMVAVKKLKTPGELRADMEQAGAKPGDGDAEDLSEKAAREHADALAEFAHEVLMLKHLKHPNVIAYLGCAIFAPPAGTGGEESLALVLEYSAHGSLKDMIQAPVGLSHAYTVAEGLQWAHDIAKGMHFLHHCKPPIMHRDLKPGNIMLCGPERRAKVADFGLAALCLERRKELARQATIALSKAGDGARSRVYKQYKTTGGVGSLRYMAPENYRGEPYGDHVDQYSFAIIVYEVLLRQKAWTGQYLTESQIADAAAGSKHLRPPLPKKWPTEVKDLLTQCWHPDPAQRPSFKPIAHTIQEFLSPDNSERILKGLSAGGKVSMLEKLGFGSSGKPGAAGNVVGSSTARD